MRRRQIFATCVLGVAPWAGCLSPGQNSPNSQRKRKISIEDTDHDLPAGLEAKAAVKRRRITAEKTALLEVTLRNSGSTSYVLMGGTEFPFSSMGSEDDTWLLLNGENPEKSTSGCWEPESFRNIGDSDVAYKYTVKPGSEYSTQFELWGNPEDERCLPTGDSWFEHQYRDMEREKSYSVRFLMGVSSIGTSN